MSAQVREYIIQEFPEKFSFANLKELECLSGIFILVLASSLDRNISV